MALGLALAGAGLASSIYGGIQTRKSAKKAEKERKRRIAQASSIYDKIADIYRPGGEYGKSLRVAQRKAGQIAQGQETMRAIQSGLAGTTYGGAVATRYEQNVGSQARLTLEDFLSSKYTGALQNKANMLLGLPDTGATYSDVANAYAGIGQAVGEFGQQLSPYLKKKSNVKVGGIDYPDYANLGKRTV